MAANTEYSPNEGESDKVDLCSGAQDLLQRLRREPLDELCLSRHAVSQMIIEIAKDIQGKSAERLRWQNSALRAIQGVGEALLIGFFEEANLNAKMRGSEAVRLRELHATKVKWGLAKSAGEPANEVAIKAEEGFELEQ